MSTNDHKRRETKKTNIPQLLGKPSSLWEKFHQKTKISRLSNLPDPKDWPSEWSQVLFKTYPRMDKIILPSPRKLKSMSLDKVLVERESRRTFSKKPLSLERLSSLLFFSAGFKNEASQLLKSRFYPSGGSRYALEVYLISKKTELASGIYHYDLRSHSLEILLSRDIKLKKYFKDEWINEASCLVIISAVFSRATMKYSNRAYRDILIESGHLGQNIYLNSTALNLSCCGISGYIDDDLNKLLDFEQFTESVVYALAIGNK